MPTEPNIRLAVPFFMVKEVGSIVHWYLQGV